MFSIIIPTMQINKKIFYMLLEELVSDYYIGEIIVIDNSLQGINYKSEKIRVITPKENIYVNPAWNLGVDNASFDYVGILNDDLIFPKKFFEQVYKFLVDSKNVGYIGLETIPKTEAKDIEKYPQETELRFETIKTRNLCWGSAIFFSKNNYFNIPEEMKVWCGDDYLFNGSVKRGFFNYAISNSNILHLHSLTSDRKEFDEIKHNDQLYYAKINPAYFPKTQKVSFLEKIFSVRNEYDQNGKHKVIQIFGIKISIKQKT